MSYLIYSIVSKALTVKWQSGPVHVPAFALFRSYWYVELEQRRSSSELVSSAHSHVCGRAYLENFLVAITFSLCHWSKGSLCTHRTPLHPFVALNRNEVMFIIICNSSSALFQTPPRACLLKRLEGGIFFVRK
jgi:hypothetical protein